MSKFIPLTGGNNLVNEIIKRFQNVPNFDFIEYIDAQKKAGELFFQLIGEAFEPYKDFETFADIEANATAFALVSESTNAQKVIEGIEPTGFFIDAPTVAAYAGNDGFILLKISNAVAVPQESVLQYRIDRGP